MGRYSLDAAGLAYAGGEWDASKYQTFIPDTDAILPICDDEYFEDQDDDQGEDLDLSCDDEKPVRSGYSVTRDQEPAPAAAAPGKVVNIHAASQLQVVLVKPEKFEDVSGIADHLNDKRTVLLNLETAAPDLKRRMVDFLSGVAYANGGQIKKIASATYIITPYNVGVIGDAMMDELENNSSAYF